MFHINYRVRSSKNLRPEEDLSVETLAESIDSYLPDADLFVQIGKHRIEMDLDRDMYGFHEDLITVLEWMTFDLPSNGPYRDEFESIQPEQKLYTMVLTEGYDPRILYLLVDGGYVYIQTRTLGKDAVITSGEDVIDPIVCPKKDLILEACSFLDNYLKDLVKEIPIVEELNDFKAYLRRLKNIQVQASV